MDSFQVRILAADKPFFDGPCQALTVPTLDGEFGILAHHSNMIAAVIPGELYYQPVGQPRQAAAVSAGLVKVEDNEVLVLVDAAERPEDIDANRARRAADEAKEALLQNKTRQEYKAAQANLARAINRLRVRHSVDC